MTNPEITPIHSIEIRRSFDGWWTCYGSERVPGRRRKLVQMLGGRNPHHAIQQVRKDQRDNP